MRALEHRSANTCTLRTVKLGISTIEKKYQGKPTTRTRSSPNRTSTYIHASAQSQWLTTVHPLLYIGTPLPQFLFIGSCDGSVSLRHAEGLERIIGSVELSASKSSQAVSRLSRAVKPMAGEFLQSGEDCATKACRCPPSMIDQGSAFTFCTRLFLRIICRPSTPSVTEKT